MHLRAMTYNIHSGFGRDGYDLRTIVRVIEHERPDVVALQEVDFGLWRTGYVNQANGWPPSSGCTRLWAGRAVRAVTATRCSRAGP